MSNTPLTAEEVQAWRADFDAWRDLYDKMSYAEHQMFYRQIAQRFPCQKKYDGAIVAWSIAQDLTQTAALAVLELGGWDGACAAEMLSTFKEHITAWHNVEICPAVVPHHGLPGQTRYQLHVPDTWAWECDMVQSYDLAILSHVIEHLSWAHLQKLLTWLHGIPTLYFQTPLRMGEEPADWNGTLSTHKLEVGWRDVRTFLTGLGYGEETSRQNPEVHLYRQK